MEDYMVRHIVLWSLEGNLTKQEKKETAGKIKELLEPIKEKVPGAVKQPGCGSDL